MAFQKIETGRYPGLGYRRFSIVLMCRRLLAAADFVGFFVVVDGQHQQPGRVQ